MTDDELIYELERAHKFRTYGGNGYTLHGEAARRLRELTTRIEQLLDTKHYLNEALLEARAELNLKEAMLRERS